MPVLNNFKIVSQGAAGNLCWACVGLGVASYYDQKAGLPPRWSRICEYVMEVFKGNDGIPPESSRCCDGQRLLDPDCNQPRFLPDAFRVSRNRGNTRDGALSFQEIQTEIDAGQPIGVEIVSSAGSHVIAIYGYDNSDGQKVMVGDPAPDGPIGVLVSYDELCTNYRHAGGTWEQSYLTFPS
jgi:hypothetical protein